MYFDIRDWLPSAVNQRELIKLIKTEIAEKHISMTGRFRDKFVTSSGVAVKQSLDVIHEELKRLPGCVKQ